jgi:hypothetical protein
VVEAGVCVDVEVLRVGVMLAEAEMRSEEDQSVTAHGGVPDGEEEGGLSGGGDRRLWLVHTSRNSAEWSERCTGPVRSSWRLKRGRSRDVLSPMAGGVGGRRCAWTERAEAGSRASRGGEIGLASTTAHGQQWIGTASARGQLRAEHGIERVGVGGRWRGGVAARGEHDDEATRVLG